MRRVLSSFIALFNSLELADTIDREEVFEAMVGLAEDGGIDAAEAERLFAEWADF